MLCPRFRGFATDPVNSTRVVARPSVDREVSIRISSINDQTYGHLARGSEDIARAKLDAHAAHDLDRSGQDWASL